MGGRKAMVTNYFRRAVVLVNERNLGRLIGTFDNVLRDFDLAIFNEEVDGSRDHLTSVGSGMNRDLWVFCWAASVRHRPSLQVQNRDPLGCPISSIGI